MEELPQANINPSNADGTAGRGREAHLVTVTGPARVYQAWELPGGPGEPHSTERTETGQTGTWQRGSLVADRFSGIHEIKQRS